MNLKMIKLLFAASLVILLALPMGFVGADNDSAPPVETEQDTSPTEGSAEVESIYVEKVPTAEVLSSANVDELFSQGPSLDDLSIDELPPSQERTPTLRDRILIPEVYPFDLGNDETFATRASDADPENDDSVNGSAFNNWGETVSGTMTHSNIPSRVDDMDWYELRLHDLINTNGGATGGIFNVTLELQKFSSPDGTLYEYSENADGTDYQDDYYDYMYCIIQYYDPFFVGFSSIGGTFFDYDDGDDTDGVVQEEGNWSVSFHTPIRAYGTNDVDGLANGLKESGFIYIGFRFGFSESQNAPATRADYTIDYEFQITSQAWDMDPVANDRLNGTTPQPASRVLDSYTNQQDWYKFSGNSMDQLWNMTFDLTIEHSSAVWYNFGSMALIDDVWVRLMYLCPNPGDDGIFDTEDDDYGNLWWGGIRIVTGLINTGAGPQVNGQWPYLYKRWAHNNWTDIPQDKRFMYVGLAIEPREYISAGGQWYGPYAPIDLTTDFTYKISAQVSEHEQNNAPTISNIEIKSTWPYDTSGSSGDYDTEFTILVTYMDEDNDPPKIINLYMDKGTYAEGVEDITVTPKDPFDEDYTSASSSGNPPGRVYQLKISGDSLTDEPSPHTIHVNCTDDVNKLYPNFEIRGPMDSLMFEFEPGITIWEDEPVEKNTNWQPFDELMEDDPTTYFALEGIDGMFKDPEGSFEAFYVWNETSEEWDTSYDTEIATITIEDYDGIWQAAVTPKHNENGRVNVKFQAEDLHSWANLSTSVIIREVNDPPMVTAIDIDGDIYEVDNIDPRRPMIHLEDKVTIKEDEEFSFTIIAEDTDKEGEQTPLEYSYVRSTSSDWDEDPDVGYNTGVVSFIPTNADVKSGNDKMVFTIDDHGEDGDIKLEVYLEVTNTNDPPTIMIPSTTARTWKQFSKITIRPIATDEDKNDQFTFSVNFEEAIGETYDSIEDQLPYFEAMKGIDWEINPTNGDFWFQLDDQNIWKTSSGMVKSQEITLVFSVTDKEGDEATAFISLVLNDENEEPEKPDRISYTPSAPVEKEPVNFWVDPVTDPDGDRLTYKWDFGDGSTGEGINVNHTYATKGYKTVQMWVEDGQFATEKISVRVEIAEAPPGDDDVGPDDDDDVTGPATETDNTMIYIIAAVIIVVVIIVVILFVFLLLRKKPAPAAQMYPGYDQQALMAYQQQGLPPGYAGELPPQATPELPPAGEGQMPPDNLPPAGGEVPMEGQPEFAPPAPEAAAPVAAAQPEQAPEQPAGNACPSCGSPVDPTWFLCPNCKSPLQ
ncbi:MAG: PKD domain-containing protein [Thermoplasmatota archaeon]